MATMWLSTPNHMIAPPNVAPPDGVRYKVIKFLKNLLTWIILYEKMPRKMLIWSPDEGEGGQQKVTVLFTFENVENVGRSLMQNAVRDVYTLCHFRAGEL